MGTTVAPWQEALIFIHLPKTAGVTFEQVLLRQYAREEAYAIYPADPGVERFNQLAEARRASIRFLHGHMAFGLHEMLPTRARYVTLLRDPVDRVISHYHYVLRTPQHRLYDRVAGGMDLRSYVESDISGEVSNGQTARIAGELFVTSEEATPALLLRAKQHIRDNFLLVGLTERFDETLLLLKKRLGWTAPIFYRKRNVTRGRPAVSSIPAETLRAIERHNELDLELYAFAQGLLAEQIAEEGESFETQIRQFRRLNGLARPLFAFRHSIVVASNRGGLRLHRGIDAAAAQPNKE